jgi:hypothetical protein
VGRSAGRDRPTRERPDQADFFAGLLVAVLSGRFEEPFDEPFEDPLELVESDFEPPDVLSALVSVFVSVLVSDVASAALVSEALDFDRDDSRLSVL